MCFGEKSGIINKAVYEQNMSQMERSESFEKNASSFRKLFANHVIVCFV